MKRREKELASKEGRKEGRKEGEAARNCVGEEKEKRNGSRSRG